MWNIPKFAARVNIAKMKTLYVSDLDGTLMRPDARISDRAAALINRAIAGGKLFTIATARTPATVSGILKDIHMNLPAVVMTGAALWHQDSGRYSRERHIDAEAAARLLDLYRRTGTSSFVFTLERDMIDIYHVGGELLPLQRQFMEERRDSPFKRFHIREDGGECLPDDLSKVILLYTMLPDAKAFSTYQAACAIAGVRPQYYHDFYGPEVGILEAFSDRATKALAVRSLARQVGADRVVCFGDNINDLPMLAEADLAVAVENALPEVKEAADIVIGPNTADAVAEFIAND